MLDLQDVTRTLLFIGLKQVLFVQKLLLKVCTIYFFFFFLFLCQLTLFFFFAKGYNPEWPDFQHSLDFNLVGGTTDSESIRRFLQQQVLRIECYAKHSLRKDSPIGVAQVDLLLCLGGPVQHKLTLFSVCISNTLELYI